MSSVTQDNCTKRREQIARALCDAAYSTQAWDEFDDNGKDYYRGLADAVIAIPATPPADMEGAVEAILREWLWAKKRVTGEGRDSQEHFDVMGIHEAAQRIAAVSALQRGVPDGWQLVPKEPTPEMRSAMWRHVTVSLTAGQEHRLTALWEAALAAAPVLADDRSAK